jgi:hypothetical protein
MYEFLLTVFLQLLVVFFESFEASSKKSDFFLKYALFYLYMQS